MLLISSLFIYAQQDVTKFLGIPVDGSKSEMIQKLKAKGYTSSPLDKDVLVGEFNADEFSDTYARLHEFVELNEKENKIALMIIVADTQCFVGFIRRLTPKECWRLQGFSDEQYLKSREAGFSDSQQYKQAGNAVTVNVVEVLAKRIKVIDERNKGETNG